jgi:hypothetical protein
MEWLSLALIVAVVITEILAIIYRAQKRKVLGNWLELLAIVIFIVFTSIRVSMITDFGTVNSGTSIVLLVFSVSLFIAKIIFFRQR